LRFIRAKARPWKTFLKKVFQTFQKTSPETALRFIRARAKPWKTFLKKSFPNLSKNFT
jgi:hypothetical protein